MSLPETMRVLRYYKTGSLDNLILETVPPPQPSSLRPGEALIKVKASGIHRSDVVGIQGWLPFVTVPRIPGRDYVGTVIAIGDSDDESKTQWIGKRVLASGGNIGFTEDGAWAEFKVSPLSTLALVPNELSDASAALAGLSWLCADLAVGDRLSSVQPTDEVVVIAANGDIGSAAVQLALARGAKKIYGTFTSPQRISDSPFVNAAHLAETFVPIDLSALGLIKRADGETTTQTKTAPLSTHLRTLGAKPTVLIDAYGSEAYINDLLEVMMPRSRIVVMANHAPDGMGTLNIRKFYARGHILYGLSSGMHTSVTAAALLKDIGERISSGLLIPPTQTQVDQIISVPLADRQRVLKALGDVAAWIPKKFVITMEQ